MIFGTGDSGWAAKARRSFYFQTFPLSHVPTVVLVFQFVFSLSFAIAECYAKKTFR